MTDDDRPRGSCVIPDCSRDPYPREGGHIPLVCGPHVSQMRHWLVEIPVHAADLAGRDTPAGAVLRAEVRETVLPWRIPLAPGVRLVAVEHLLVADMLPAAMTPGAARGGRVSGSAEPRLPIRVDAIDLLAPTRTMTTATAPLAYPEQDDDQIGFLPVAWTLDSWAQDLRDHRRVRGEALPDPAVTVLARWLLERIDEAADDWLPIDEFFEDIRRVHGALRGQLGLHEQRKEELLGVPCSACDVRLLVRLPGSSYVECEACGHLLTEDEYAAWCKTAIAAARKSVTPQT